MESTATTLNLASIIEHHARIAPDKEAIVWNDTRLTFGELNALANQTANALTALNVGHGDKVALCCPNLPYFPILYYAIMKTGAAVVPLSILFKPREIAYHLRDSDAKAVFVFEGTAELPLAQTVKEAFDQIETCEQMVVMTIDENAASPIENAVTLHEIIKNQPETFETFPTAPSDTCAILYTSGTTGQPKGAELTHLNLMSNVTTMYNIQIQVLDLTESVQRTCLITLPLFHTTAQTCQMNTHLYGGNRLVLLPRFEPLSTLEAMEKEAVNYWTGVPAMYWSLLRYAEENDFDTTRIAENMKITTSGGAPMPVEVMRSFESKFNVRVLEGYGLSETSPLAVFSQFEKPSKPGTVGQPIFGIEVKCVDENDVEVESGMRGEIVIRGSNVMKGYYKRPEATAEAFKNGWFHTGDIGVFDADGYLAIVDRKKDMILRGGYNVYPRELEEVIMSHEAVSLVAVIGVPDARLGEEIKAFVVKKAGAEISEEDFLSWCKAQFAKYKYPRLVEFRSELPLGGTGKIFKRALRETVENK